MTLLIHAGLLLAAVGLALALARASRALTIPVLLVAGVAVGPHALGLLQDAAVLDAAGDLGLSLLLFYTAMLTRPDAIRRGGRIGATLAAYDIALNVAAAWWVGALFGLDTPTRLLLAGVMATSSTGAVMKILGDEGRLRNREGQVLTAVMWIEDIAFVSYFLFLTGQSKLLAPNGLYDAGLAFAGFAGLLILARLFRNALWRIRSLELLIPAVTGIGLIASGLGALAGLPPAGAAFTAGLVLGTPRARRVVGHEAPHLREASAAIFFVAFGATLDPTATGSILPLAATAAAAILVTGLIFITHVSRLLGLTGRESLTVGSSLLARGGKSVSFARLDPSNANAGVIQNAAGLLTLVLTPLSPLLVRLVLATGRRRRKEAPTRPPYRELVSQLSRRILMPTRFHQRDLAPLWRRLETALWVLLPLSLALFASSVPLPMRLAPAVLGLAAVGLGYHATRDRLAGNPSLPRKRHATRRAPVPATDRYLPILLHAPAVFLLLIVLTTPWIAWALPVAAASLFLVLLLLPVVTSPQRPVPFWHEPNAKARPAIRIDG